MFRKRAQYSFPISQYPKWRKKAHLRKRLPQDTEAAIMQKT